ncbi:hypothetical protein SUGI_0264610 [Cryptomeria japonica]|uniref:type I inositol polyphosphate 5-phosphatase 8 n=1 Tax=Cryptomeria japonica TaxID=3369 RepID=UPI002408C381|nr:type I inositol polyphosphate 5-phosphatase 8 [Cryptomeria japonica]GLJ15984.1 hypothetical protein SUGI_0264610 [Cryptomeria japonica]
MWPRLMANKWLRLKSGGEKFKSDAEDEAVHAHFSNGLPNLNKSPKSCPALLRGQSETLWTECVDNFNYRMFVGTWNVGGRTPKDTLDLENWLGKKESCDIFVIGLQEIVPLKARKIFGAQNSRAADKWDALIRGVLNKRAAPENDLTSRSTSFPFSDGEESPVRQWIIEDTHSIDKFKLDGPWSERKLFIRVASKQMVGIFITVWVKSEVRHQIRDLKVSCVGCGIMGCLGNKGSVSVSLSFHQTSFCFVCTHLASGQKQGDEIRRNSDVVEILKRTYFPRDTKSGLELPQTIEGHDCIIWFGDLNYRLTIGESEAKSLIHQKDWKTLRLSDQLQWEKNAGRFEGWEEGHLDFAPTYKYAAHSDQYCCTQDKPGGKCRVPAWCDRILWYGKGMKQLSYERAESTFSDHRPVSAIFTSAGAA